MFYILDNFILNLLFRIENPAFWGFDFAKSCSRSCFLIFSFIYPKKKDFFIFFGIFLYATNYSYIKSCSLMFFLMHKIMLFGAFPRTQIRALDRAFWRSPSCHK